MIKLASSFGGLAATRSQRSPPNYLLRRAFLLGSCDDLSHVEGHVDGLDELSEEEIVWGEEEEEEAKDPHLGRNVVMQNYSKHAADHQQRYKKQQGSGPHHSSKMQIHQALQRSAMDDHDDDHEPENEQEEEEGVRMLLPPHEILAREYAATRLPVLQGTGRTLKGMNLCRLRNAIWSQTTGFAD